MKDLTIFKTKRIRLSFAWYDIWIGAYIDTDKKRLYICLLPTLLITIQL
jgi:hypothetical protein